jgi:hypothetical protein
LLAGGFPYSEGIYEDINKVMVLQRYWDPARTLSSIMHEYAAAIWSPQHAESLVEVLTALEPREIIHIHSDLRADLFKHTSAPESEALTALHEHPLYSIPDSSDAVKVLDVIERDLPDAVRLHWRWRILRIRAALGDEMAHSGGRVTSFSEACFTELIRIYHAQGADRVVKPPSLAMVKSVFRARLS